MVNFLVKKKDDFNQIPKPISQQKPGDLLSQGKARNLPDLPGKSCDINTPGIFNLDIIKTKGRMQGESVLYSADQIYNYKSQSQRYDRALGLIPAYVNEDDDAIIYGFCSHNSPKGFWEVTVSKRQQATFIELSPRVITILCPRPFSLDEFITIATDSSEFKHTQIAGNRTVLILPDDIKYPLYDIQSSCFTDTCDSGSTSPLIIRIETDNPLLFADLVILNRPIDNFDGLGYVGIVDTSIDARKVKTFYRVPDDLQRVYLWQGTPLIITWLPPTQDSEFVTQYIVQINILPYTNNQIFTPNQSRKALLNANQRYRIATDFNTFGNTDTSYSDPVFFNYPIADTKILFADDSCNALGFAYIGNSYSTVNFGNQLVNEIDANNIGSGFAYIDNSYNTANFGNQLVNEIDANNIGSGFAFVNTSYVKIDLGGVIIG